MSQFRFLVTFFAGTIAAAACSTTPTSPPQTTTEVTVTPPSATEKAPPVDQPLPEPADQPLPEPASEAGKPPPPVPADPVDHMAAPGFIACTPETRKKACTKEHKPVCGVVDTGIRCIRAPCPSTAEQTFGNACSACADSKTSGYRTGACATPSPQGSKPELQ